MSRAMRQLAKQSKTAIIAYKIFENHQIKKRFQSGNFETLHGATHIRKSISESLNYIDSQFADYLAYSGLSQEMLRGKRIFELGFGDNVGVALRFLAAGAARVVCLDKFYSKRDIEQQRAIYFAMRERLSLEERVRFDAAINLANGVETNSNKLQCIYGKDVENSPELNGEAFDLAISRGAIQDIFDPGPAFLAMDRILAPGGFMLHKIDLSDQGMFRDHGMNPLTFLTIPDSIYRLMAVDSGRPNRKLAGYYRDLLKSLGYEPRVFITSLVGGIGKGDMFHLTEIVDANDEAVWRALSIIKQIRPNLNSRFRALPDEELMVDGIFLVARKPEPRPEAEPGPRTNAGARLDRRLTSEVTKPLASPNKSSAAPAVSVVIPVYRAERYIGDALDSVFAQTFPDYEVIVVDDGSPDADALNRALKPYRDRILYIRQQNRGPSAARNTGINRARGEFIAFLDSDDYWEPEYLSQQLALLNGDPGLDVVYTDARIAGDSELAGRTFMQDAPSEGEVTFEGLLRERCTVILSGAVAKRRALIDAGQFNEEFSYAEDFDLWLRLIKRGARFAYQTRVLLTKREHSGSLCSDMVNLFENALIVLDRARLAYQLTDSEKEAIAWRQSKLVAYVNLERGKRHLANGDFNSAIESIRTANKFYRGWKLRAVLLSLAIAPWAVRKFYRAPEVTTSGAKSHGRIAESL